MAELSSETGALVCFPLTSERCGLLWSGHVVRGGSSTGASGGERREEEQRQEVRSNALQTSVGDARCRASSDGCDCDSTHESLSERGKHDGGGGTERARRQITVTQISCVEHCRCAFVGVHSTCLCCSLLCPCSLLVLAPSRMRSRRVARLAADAPLTGCGSQVR